MTVYKQQVLKSATARRVEYPLTAGW